MKMAGIGMKEKVSEQKSLNGWELEKKWEDGYWPGVCVYKDKFVVVNGQTMKQFGMDGEFKDEFTFEGIEAWDVEVLENTVYISDRKNRAVILCGVHGRKKRREMCLPENEKRPRLFNSLCLAGDRISKDIYVSSNKANTVYKWDVSRKTFLSFIKNGLSGPCYMCVTRNHNLVVSNESSHTITTYTPWRELMWKYGDVQGSDKGQLSHPMGVCTDNKGHVIICDSDNNRLVVISEEKGHHVMDVNIGEMIVKPKAVSFGNGRLVVTTDNPYHIYVIKGKYS